MIFKYLTSIVKPCVFKLFSLRKITKSNFHHHLPTLNIANLFMQSFASSLPPPTQSHTNPPPPHKNHAPHQKGATIAHTHALSTQKSIERAQLSPIPAPFLPKIHRKGATIACFGEKYYYLCKKQINHNYYDKQRINRKSL